jgi:F420 biosynthesis protein FbiB-like protein
MSLLELMRRRRSVRRFTAQPPTRDQILTLLEAARWAPSPHGRQPWRFVVVESAAARQRLAAALGDEWRAQLALDGTSPEEVERRLQISQRRIIGAPVIIVPCLLPGVLDVYPDAVRQAAERTMAVQSLGCAIQNLLLAATDLGLACGWMCAPLFAPQAVREALDLADGLEPQALLPLGYVAQEPQRRERLPLEDLIGGWF